MDRRFGAGSFTGMCMAAALVEGLAFNNPQIKTRCVPTALALADNLPSANEERTAVIFDGRNREILIFGAVNKNGNIVPDGTEHVLDAKLAPSFFAENKFVRFTAFASDRQAIGKIVPGEIVEKVKFIETFTCFRILFFQGAKRLQIAISLIWFILDLRYILKAQINDS